jgi:hypothetical protein
VIAIGTWKDDDGKFHAGSVNLDAIAFNHRVRE